METKQVLVSEKTLEFLQDFITELNTQGNRATATPYYFTIRNPLKHYGIDSDYADEYEWFDEDGDCVGADADLRMYIQEKFKDEISNNTLGDVSEILQNNQVSFKIKLNLTDCELENVASDLNFKKTYYKSSQEFKGVFFTESSCNEHLEKNKHHYNEGASSYVIHFYRNPEVEKLLKAVGEVAGISYETK